MNERIRELAEQAEFSEKDLHIQDDNFQKFAELIVRECADLVEVEYGQIEVTGSEVAQVLKRHFGVDN
jgi:acetone carboxylase gamma subunit